MSRENDQVVDLDVAKVDEDNVEDLINQMDHGADEEGGELEETKLESDEDEGKESDDKPNDRNEATENQEPKSVVKSRDGKHDIPYSVLANERTRNLELQGEIDALKADKAEQVKAEPKTNTQDENGTSSDMDDEDLELFREEFGDEAAEAEIMRREKYKSMELRQNELESELEEQKNWRKGQEAKSQQDLTSEVNEAIDSNPDLQGWRDSGDPMWDAAVALDNRLKSDPEFQDMSYRERFNVVVGRLTGRKPDSKQDERNEVDAMNKKLEEKELSGSRPPSSLSDLPGGHSVDQSDNDTLERLTPLQIEAKFADMTDIQQDEYLARL